jgi:hypothetical protein
MRGRLINRFVAVIYRLDPVATAAVVGAGYDDEFGSLRPVDNGSQAGTSTRRERVALRLPVQIDSKTWDDVILTRGGHEATADLELCLHMPDLRAAGLVDVTGVIDIAAGDRIDSIEARDGEVQAKFVDPPGLFVTKVEPRGYGLAAFGTPKFNLVILTCGPQRQGA